MSVESQATGSPAPIVVGVDGSRAASAALRWALEEARRRGCAVDAVIAWRPAAMLAGAGAKPPASTRTIAEQRADALAVLEQALRPPLGEVSLEPLPDDSEGATVRPGGVASGGASGGVELRPRAVRGSPHRVLLDAALHAEMLVIGGRSGRLGGRLPWSTGQQLVRDASCPVVVVPPRAP